MKVIATKIGFYKGRRVRAGEEFEFDMRQAKKAYKRDANGRLLTEKRWDPQLGADREVPIEDPNHPVLPSWMVEANPENRAGFNKSVKDAERRARDAAIASAGPKRPRAGFASAPGAEDASQPEPGSDLV